MFTDASRVGDVEQLGIFTSLLIGVMNTKAIYHVVSWVSHMAKRLVKSIQAAEILAAAEGIDGKKALSKAYSELLGKDVELRLCVCSKDLFTSLSTKKSSIDNSIRGDVGCIRYEFQIGAVQDTSSIPGTTNLADPLTNRDSSLDKR